MAFDPQPLIYGTTSTTGTGPFVFAVVAGYRSASNIANGDTVPLIRWDSAGNYEEGEASVNTSAGVTTITWVTRTRTSNTANAAVTWAGTQNVKVDGLGSLMLHWRNYGSEFAANAALFRTNTSTERKRASGTKEVFVQSAAPTDYTQVTSVNDKALRIVSGAGGGTGGSNTIAGVVIGNTSITIPNLAAHDHGLYQKKVSTTLIEGNPTPNVVADVSDGTDGSYTHISTEDAGSGTAHTHSFAHDGTKTYAYQDCIVCSHN